MSNWLKCSWCLFFILCLSEPGMFLARLTSESGFLSGTCYAQGQRISFVYPSGGQRGTTFEVLIGVRNARQISEATVSGKGVSVRIIQGAGSFRLNEETERNVIRDHFQKAVDRLYQGVDNPPWFGSNPIKKKTKEELAAYPKMEDLRKKRIWLDKLDADAPGTLEEQRIFLQRFYYEYFIRRPDRSLPDSVPGYLRAEITIDADAPVGWRELYLLGPSGLTSPTVFHVSPCREVCEIEPNDSDDPSQRGIALMGGARKRALDWVRAQLPTQELPVIVNGQTRPGDTDRFFFKAKKGAKLVFVVWGRFLSPYLADGVPGWFSPVISLYDPDGKLVRTAHSWRFDPDPVLLFEVPTEGVWRMDIQDALFRGRSDFVYRCAIGEFPFVTSRSTLGTVGDSTIVRLDGWNLPTQSIRIPGGRTNSRSSSPFILNVLKGESMPSASGLQPLAEDDTPADFTQWLPRPVVFQRDQMKVVEQRVLRRDQGKADSLAVTLPVIIEGSIAQANQKDCYSFDGKKGEKLVVDVSAIGLDSTMDASVELLDPSGKVVATNDDRADEKGPNIGLETHHADPYLLYTFPEDGRYTVGIHDVLSGYGPSCAYRMRLSQPHGDFAVYASPSSSTARGNTIRLQFTAVRKDGFKGEIKISSEEGSPFHVHAGVIPSGLDSIDCTATVDGVIAQPQAFSLFATAMMNGKKITHPVIASDEMEQAFIYHHLVQRDALRVVKPYRGGYVFAAKNVKPVTLEYGKEFTLEWSVLNSPAKQPLDKLKKVSFEVSDPHNIEIRKWSCKDDVLKLVMVPVRSDDPGQTIDPRGNIVIDMSFAKPATRGKVNARRSRDQLPSVPYRMKKENKPAKRTRAVLKEDDSKDD